MRDPTDKSHLKEMAEAMSVPVYQRYTETGAAQVLDISVPTLKRLRANGKISYMRISERKIVFFGFQILEYLLNVIEGNQCPDIKPKTVSESEITGSQNNPEATRGVERGLITKLDKQSVLASAQRILKTPNKS